MYGPVFAAEHGSTNATPDQDLPEIPKGICYQTSDQQSPQVSFYDLILYKLC